MQINHICDLIPQDAHSLRRAFSSLHYAESQLSRVCLATAAIALAIINIPLYLYQNLATSQWHYLDEAGKSLLFIVVTVAAIFASFYQDNIFAPPEVLAEEIPKPIVPQSVTAPAEVLEEETPKPIVPQSVTAPAEFVAHPIPEQIAATYLSLPMTESQKTALGDLVTTLAPNSLWINPLRLLNHQPTLATLHPLRFIGFCISRDYKKHLKQIRYGGDGTIQYDKKRVVKSGFYWGRFVNPLGDSMKTHLERGAVLPYIDDFAKTFKADSTDIRRYLSPLNCEGLVDYLLSL